MLHGRDFDQSAMFSKVIPTDGYSTCGLTKQGKVYCWGNMGPVPMPIAQGQIPDGVAVEDIFYCDAGLCLIANGVLYKTTTPAVVNTGLPAGVTIRSISSSQEHTCLIGSNDKVYCWGSTMV